MSGTQRLPVRPEHVAGWCAHLHPTLDEAACVRIAALADINAWGNAPSDRKKHPRPIQTAIRTLLSRAVEAEEHWRKKAEIPTHAAQATEYITRIGELRRALMFRPGHDFEWLLEWDVTTHTRAPDGQARYLAEIIAREMRRAGHQMVSDGAGSPLVKAICAALPHFGMTGTLTAISMDLRENRPASGWGAESS